MLCSISVLLLSGTFATAKADTLYTSLKLQSGAAATLTQNAYGVGLVSDIFSIEFASPFMAPTFDSIATNIRVPVALDSGENAFVLSVYSNNSTGPTTLLGKKIVQNVMLPGRGDPSYYWLDVQLPTGIALVAGHSYSVGLRALDSADTFFLWLRPNTDLSVVNSYRDTTVLSGAWNSMYSYYPAAFEVIGVPSSVPEPATALMLLLGLAVTATSRIFLAVEKEA